MRLSTFVALRSDLHDNTHDHNLTWSFIYDEVPGRRDGGAHFIALAVAEPMASNVGKGIDASLHTRWRRRGFGGGEGGERERI